ncbi:methylmalonyl-CoA mutase family protein [Coraliomargarita sp. SDUM461004]|uniref:Methylmalonyl-CoA mutase family protein n=1 Tax=Thalassobacterium sedimentorum TaxID=3041258 RepID=A0ABU1AH92_9BACT|nr:methylmalonyl-CoA mutase family protein [Coraliomargarita sp. SDUM461004]MDQ8194099.1 methylmalonyl-CoA mutase family protein [Coraliomargarita sp. SDUM461004]
MKTDKQATQPLLTEFPATSAEEWRDAAEKLLKGKPFDKVMTRQTPEGIRLEPIFRKEVLDGLSAAETFPGFDGYLRGTSATGYQKEPWEIAQELPYGTPIEFNTAARADLMRGQNALNVLLDIATLKGLDPDSAQSGEVGACGLSLACLKDIEVAFDEIMPEAVSFHFRTGCSGLSVGSLFFAWLKQQAVDLKKVKGSLGMDPIAVKAAAGQVPAKMSELLSEQAIMANYCAQEAPGIRAVGVSSLPYHQAGASAVEELGICLATGVTYLNEMIERGLSVDTAAQQIRFSFCIGPNFFMEIAKLRAARVLWAQIVKAFGGNAESQKIVMHARTGLYNKTQKDPYVNMLRTTTEALSGAIGGVDSMCVGNFDEVSRLPDAFSRRISRNTQIILQEECELTSVVDPAGGSWAVEWLTNEVSEKSWELFKAIEAEGGMTEALKNGYIHKTINATAKQNEALLGARRTSLVGTNVYPNLEEKELETRIPDYVVVRDQRAREIAAARMELDEAADATVMEALGKIVDSSGEDLLPILIQAVEAGATIGEISKTIRATVHPDDAITPLPTTRLASKYEALRAASARFAEKTGRAPAIFLTNLGPLRRHKARADFTKGFFQSGGFEVMSPTGFESPQDAVAALAESKAGITVVCGTDDDYAEKFADYAQAIKAALPEMQVILAGYPGEKEAAYKEAGMDDYIFIKSDNYELNRRYLTGLGVL